MDCMWVFLSAFCVVVEAAPTVRILTATEGGNVTLWKELNNQTQAILSCGPDRATLLNYDNGFIERRKDNILVENGDIVMTNVQKNDSKVDCELNIIDRDNIMTPHYFELDVIERLRQDTDYATPQTTLNPPPGTEDFCTNWTACISVGLGTAAVVLTVLVLVYWKREWIKNKIGAVNRALHPTVL